MNKIDNKNIIICPNSTCTQIPEISYTYEPMNPTIKLKCNSKIHEVVEKKLNLKEFLKNSYLKVECSYCNGIIEDFEFIYNNKQSSFYHINCLNFFNLYDDYHKINQNAIFNNCLVHDKKFFFYCLNCKISLCPLCDLETHNEKGHKLQQIIFLRRSQNIIDEKKSIISKQRKLLNKIKEINTKLFKSFEKDIIIKEKIIGNYETNINNVQSIKNFNNLEIKNNEEYEKKINNIINKYNEYEKSQDSKMEDKMLNDIILLPFYYAMMISNNKGLNNSINNKLNTPFDCKKEENEAIILISDINNKDNNINLSTSSAYHDKSSSKIEYNHKDLINIKQEKSIFNLIILRSGNIATSSYGAVTIYDSKNLLSSNSKNYILQTINIFKKNQVSYVFEFPDKTLLCSVVSKIFHLKLIDNDKRYNILGFIPLDKREFPSKLISLRDTFLIILTVIEGNSYIRLFINKKEYEKNNSDLKNYNEINNFNDYKQIDEIYYNSDNQSDDYLNDYIESTDKKKTEFYKEFFPYNKQNNINIDLKYLCSVFEIQKNSFNNKNGHKYEFISTSNSIYDYGEDKLTFYKIHLKEYNKFEVEIIKKIDNISCSAEVDSICQLSNKFICVGLQNHNKENQINGFALINIAKREIFKIIEDYPVYSLSYNIEKKLLISAMDLIKKEYKHNYLITLYSVVESIDEINLNQIYQYKSEYNDIIISLSQIKNNELVNRKNNEEKIIFISASLDSKIILTEVNKIKYN